MSLQHSRDPYSMGDFDYGEFTQELNDFLSDDRSLPHRPEHLVAEQAAKGVTFRNSLDAMNAALAARKTASDTISETVEGLYAKLRWMQTILPTLSDETILIPFGLDKSIPDKYAEMKDMVGGYILAKRS